MTLAAGGHLTHGAPAELLRQVVPRLCPTGVREDTHQIDYDAAVAQTLAK